LADAPGAIPVPLTGKWVRARYLAERHVIAERYAEFEIIGPPEIRDVDPDARYFNPTRNVWRPDAASAGNVSAVYAVARSAGGRQHIVVAGIAG